MTLSRGPGVHLANPVLVYSTLWLGVLGLIELRLTTYLIPLATPTLWLVLGNVATCAIAYAVLSRVPLARFTIYGFRHDLLLLHAWVNTLLTIWAVGSLLEIALAQGLPIVWLLMGDTSRDYRDFGVPTFHGLMTAIYLFCVAARFLEYCARPPGRRRRNLLLQVGTLLVWPVLQVNRGALVWALFEILGVYLLARRVTVRRLFRTGFFLAASVVLFGVIGDARGGGGLTGLEAVVSDDAQYMTRLPSGFLWVYVYVTSPLNNVNRALVEQMQPVGQLYFSTVNLLPTIIRNVVYNDPDRRYPVQLVNEAFNTSTWYAGFLADFGIWWALIAAALFQVLAIWAYLRARAHQMWAILIYAAVFQALALSIFADTMTSLVTLGQLGLAFHFQRRVQARAHRPDASHKSGGPGPFDQPTTVPA